MLFVWSRRTPFPRCYQHGLRKLLYLVVRIQRHYWNRRNLSRLAHSPFSKDRCSSFSDWEFLTCYILERLRFQRIRWVHASSKLVRFSTEIGVFEHSQNPVRKKSWTYCSLLQPYLGTFPSGCWWIVYLSEPGAKVAVLCKTDGPNDPVADSAFATTDEFGNFTIDLPSQLHATENLERACTVKVLQLPADSSCRLRHCPSTTYGLRLSSQEDGVRAYTTGVIRIQNSDTPHDKCVSVEERTERRWTIIWNKVDRKQTMACEIGVHVCINIEEKVKFWETSSLVSSIAIRKRV